MNLTSIRNLFLFSLIITAFSCSSDDSVDDNPNPEEGQEFVLKSITSNNNNKVMFNTAGRFIGSTVNENMINELKLEHTLNELNLRIKTTIQRPGLSQITDYSYDNSGKIIEIKKVTEDPFSTTELITTYLYTNNQIIATNTENNEDFEYVFTFSSNTFDKLTGFRATNLNTNEVFFEETYSYHPNGNLQKTTILNSVNEQIDAVLMTYEYDNKINPWEKGNHMDYLNEILIAAQKNTGSLVTVLVNFAKNNRLTSFVENSTISLEYNDQDYIVKETDASNNSNGPSSDTIRIFEYY